MVTIDLNKTRNNICLLCTKEVTTQKITSIFQNTRLINLLSRGTGINIDPDPAYPDTVCIQCVMTVNIYLDFQNRIKRNLMKFRLNHCVKTGGDMSKVRRYKNEINPLDHRAGDASTSQQNDIEETFSPSADVDIAVNADDDEYDECSDEIGITSDISSYIDENVIGTNTSPIIISNIQCEETIEMENQQYGMDVSGLLEPMYSTSENLSDTESGGNLHVQNDAEYNRRRRNNETKFQCSFCPKVYLRSYYYKKHLRKHTEGYRHRESEYQTTQQQDQKQQQPQQSQQFSSQRVMPSYACTNCPEILSSMHLLRKHIRIHDKQMECPLCKMKFVLKNDFSWHIIECAAINEATKDLASDNDNEKYIPKIGRITRSRGLAQSIYINENYGNEADDDLQSVCSSSTTKTDSLYNERQSYAKRWSENLQKPSKRPMKRRQLSIYSDASDQSTDTDLSSLSSSSVSRNRVDKKAFWKRRRVEKKRARKIGVDYYNCSFENCEFGCLSLSETMLHEVKHHNVLLLHFCNECKEWFSTRENLIRHRKRHETFVQLCSNCYQHFDNKYDLEHHLMLHHEISFPCRCCNMSFLKESEQERHMLALHKNEHIIKQGIIDRKYYKYNNNNKHHRSFVKPFEKYKTKCLVQNNYKSFTPSVVNNGTEKKMSSPSPTTASPKGKKDNLQSREILKQQKRELFKLRVGTVSHYHRKRLGNASGIRKSGINMCNEYFEYISDWSRPFVSTRNGEVSGELDARNVCATTSNILIHHPESECVSVNTNQIFENNSDTNNSREKESRFELPSQNQQNHQTDIPLENGEEDDDEEEVITCFKEEYDEDQFYFNKNEFNLFSTDILQSVSGDEDKSVSLDSQRVTTANNNMSINDNEINNDNGENIDYDNKCHENSNVNVLIGKQQSTFEQIAVENSWNSLTVVLMSERQRKRAKKLQISENAPMAVIDSSCKTLLPKSLIQRMQY